MVCTLCKNSDKLGCMLCPVASIIVTTKRDSVESGRTPAPARSGSGSLTWRSSGCAGAGGGAGAAARARGGGPRRVDARRQLARDLLFHVVAQHREDLLHERVQLLLEQQRRVLGLHLHSDSYPGRTKCNIAAWGLLQLMPGHMTRGGGHFSRLWWLPISLLATQHANHSHQSSGIIRNRRKDGQQ